MENGLILVNTGNGKGKTTAALGLAFRAIGQGMKVLMLQFIKGSKSTGELKAVKFLEPDFKIIQLGQGFIKNCKKDISEKAKLNIHESWEYAKQEINSDTHDMIILDEINYAIDYGLLNIEEVVSVLQKRPKRLNVILTGRNAKNEIIELADIVTEMRDIKHHYKNGVKARKGIEY